MFLQFVALVDVKYLTLQLMILLVTHLPITVHIHSNPDIPPLSIHRSLWWYVEGSGKANYLIVWNFCSQTFTGIERRWRYFEGRGGGAIYLGLTVHKMRAFTLFQGCSSG